MHYYRISIMDTVLCGAPQETQSSGLSASLFSEQWVRLTRKAYIALVAEAHSYKSLHERAVKRLAALKEKLRETELAAARRESELRAELEQAKAMVLDLRHRLFGQKNERTKADRRFGTNKAARTSRPRGQQRGTRGHGRSRWPQLPAREEFIEINAGQCPVCGLPLAEFPGTDDSEVIEIEVRAYRRVIHRRRYRCTCDCGALPGIVTAPPPTRLIERGKYGLSVWVMVLLDKYVYGRPSRRLLHDLANLGIPMSAGSLDGGLQALVPLLTPLDAALHEKLCSESHWHADETRWPVFVEREGKIGHRWCLWVFRSASVVHYVVDPSRSSDVIEAELSGVKVGIISCDRLSAYQKFAREHPGIELSFCWAHQRRDFIELAIKYPWLEDWAMQWVDRIGELYHLRKQQAAGPLRQALERMSCARDAVLTDDTTPIEARKVLQSMNAHWDGLTLFADHPEFAMDNNAAERAIRTAVVGRKNFYGSGSQWSAELAARMYGLAMTAQVWGLNVRHWLSAYLQACAENSNRAPACLDAFLPWRMNTTCLAANRSVGQTCPEHRPFETS